MYKLPIEKSDKKQHFRTSKTGKVFSAGKGVEKQSNKVEKLINTIKKNPKNYINRFNFENIKDDLKDVLDHPILQEYFPGIVRSEAKFDPSSGETREDLEYQAQIDEIEDSKKEVLLDAWINFLEKEDPEKLEEEFHDIAYDLSKE